MIISYFYIYFPNVLVKYNLLTFSKAKYFSSTIFSTIKTTNATFFANRKEVSFETSYFKSSKTEPPINSLNNELQGINLSSISTKYLMYFNNLLASI